MGAEERSRRFWKNLVIAFLPAAILGLLLGTVIKAHLFSPIPVASAFIIGGLAILWAERRKHTISVDEVDAMTWRGLGLAAALPTIAALLAFTAAFLAVALWRFRWDAAPN